MQSSLLGDDVDSDDVGNVDHHKNAVPGTYRETATNLTIRREYRRAFGMLRTLARWRSSLWRAVWKELAVWLLIYFSISLWYRYGMLPHQRKVFENWCNMSSCALSIVSRSYE